MEQQVRRTCQDKTLIIIDMQPGFSASNHQSIRKPCISEVQQAIDQQWAVIVVEYDGFGSTHPWLFEMLLGHSRLQVIHKDQDDGSAAILWCMCSYEYPTPIRVCGINWNCCVKKTVISLSKQLSSSRIEVVRAACSTATPPCNWKQFNNYKNVVVV